MRAVVCHEIGPVEKLRIEETPTPVPQPGQVRIAVKAAGASFVDALRVNGRHQMPLVPPYTPGGEAAGIVDAVGSGVAEFKVGDRVYATVRQGAMASHLLATPNQLVTLPNTIDFGRGASFHQVYGTAWFAFVHRTVVRPGEVVLVTGAGGGVGLAAIDVARHLGARVIAVASSEEKRALALSMGAEAAIDPLNEDVKLRARELTGGQGIDLVYDVVGGDMSEAALRAMKFEGRFLVIGFTAGIARVPLNLALLNNRSILGVEWGGWAKRFPQESAKMVADIVAAIASGGLNPVAPTERPLEATAEVLSDLLERRALGKIVLIP